MKKKVLIVSDSLNMGGLEKCLINLCDNFDYDKYEVDLYLFNEGRTLLPKLNKNVNLLPDSPYYKDVYNLSIGTSLKALLKKRKFRFAWYRLIRFIRIRFGDYKYRNVDWEIMQQTMLQLDQKYDVAIGFAEGTSCYYVANCVQADIKIGWIHTDLKKVDHNRKLDQQAFEILDRVATVSQNSLNSLIEIHESCKDKFVCIKLPGLMDYETINMLAKEPNQMLTEEGVIRILSVGRLVELKGFHLCVPVCKRLIDEGYKIKWYVAGEGDFRTTLEAEIEKYGVKDNFILLGNCANPYTYINSADIYVQPSSYEGFGMSVLEGKYFEKAVVVTNISSFLEMITDKENGIVVERTVDAIYCGVKYLLDNPIERVNMAQTPIKGLPNNQQIMRDIEMLFVPRGNNEGK